MDNNNFYTVRGYQILEQNKNWLTPSLEDYLEMIYRSILNDGYIRVSALANDLNVKPSSASKMIIKLTKLGFVDYQKYGVIKLTEHGNEVGKYLLWRHNVLRDFFALVLQEANESAFIQVELTEHILDKNTVERLEKITTFFEERKYVFDDLKRHLSKE